MERAHQPKRNSPQRAAMLANRRRDQESRTGRFIPVPAKRSLSTRGDTGETWRTKRWTASRWKYLDALDHVNWPMTEALSDRFDGRAKLLRNHIALHPNDFGARSALERLSI